MENKFEGASVYITLLKNAKQSSLQSLTKDYPNNICFINPKNILTLKHLQIAIARAISNQRAPQQLKMFKTKSLGTEIIYSLSPTHSIKEVIQKEYGLPSLDLLKPNFIVAVFINQDLESIQKIIHKEIREASSQVEEVVELEMLSELTDISSVKKIFKASKCESSSLLSFVYNTIVLKGNN